MATNFFSLVRPMHNDDVTRIIIKKYVEVNNSVLQQLDFIVSSLPQRDLNNKQWTNKCSTDCAQTLKAMLIDETNTTAYMLYTFVKSIVWCVTGSPKNRTIGNLEKTYLEMNYLFQSLFYPQYRFDANFIHSIDHDFIGFVTRLKEYIKFEYTSAPFTGVWENDSENIRITLRKPGLQRLILGFGPSASGKTFIAKTMIELLIEDENKFFISIDGGLYRETSIIYQTILEKVKQRGYIGLTNMHKIIFDASVLKNKFMDFLNTTKRQTNQTNQNFSLYVPETLGGCDLTFTHLAATAASMFASGVKRTFQSPPANASANTSFKEKTENGNNYAPEANFHHHQPSTALNATSLNENKLNEPYFEQRVIIPNRRLNIHNPSPTIDYRRPIPTSPTHYRRPIPTSPTPIPTSPTTYSRRPGYYIPSQTRARLAGGMMNLFSCKEVLQPFIDYTNDQNYIVLNIYQHKTSGECEFAKFGDDFGDDYKCKGCTESGQAREIDEGKQYSSSQWSVSMSNARKLLHSRKYGINIEIHNSGQEGKKSIIKPINKESEQLCANKYQRFQEKGFDILQYGGSKNKRTENRTLRLSNALCVKNRRTLLERESRARRLSKKVRTQLLS